MIHRKKNRPALQRHDILTLLVFCFLFFFRSFLIGNLLMYTPTQFLVVLFFIVLYTAPFSSKHFFLGLFVRSLSTQLFLVVVFLLLLSMTDFSYVGRAPFSVLSTTFSRSLPEPSSTQLFSSGVVF